ncbi:MAG: hypothetical protein SCK28_06865 [Bacillota bacterium]|nr:hypothetical protein [Bacillota bacterium]
MVKVKYYSIYALATGKLEEVFYPGVDFNTEQISLAYLLTLLLDKYGHPLAEKIFDDEQQFRPLFWLILDGERLKLPKNPLELEHIFLNVSPGTEREVIISTPMLVGG